MSLEKGQDQFLNPGKGSESPLKSFFFFNVCMWPWFYQASELSQLDPGEGTSVSLVMAQG